MIAADATRVWAKNLDLGLPSHGFPFLNDTVEHVRIYGSKFPSEQSQQHPRNREANGLGFSLNHGKASA